MKQYAVVSQTPIIRMVLQTRGTETCKTSFLDF